MGEELELLSSQSVYKYASEFPSGATPLQLFDFLELLKKVGCRAFAAEPRNALHLVLSALEDSLTTIVPEVCALHVEPREETKMGAEQSSAEEDEELVDMRSLLQG